jgi:flagellar basal-body rod modification protein FlgD
MAGIPAVHSAALDLTKSLTNNEPATAKLDKDSFLKLLTAQMRYQDPLKPTDQTGQLAQLAQFSTLEAMTNLTAQTESLAKAARTDWAVSLVGREVKYRNEAGEEVAGTVEKVTWIDGEPRLTIGGAPDIDPGKITEVV